MKKRVSVILILMLALALCLSAAAMATVRLLEVGEGGTETTTKKVYTDGFDEKDGSLKEDTSITGVLYDGSATLEGDRTYIVEGETVINGDLTIKGSVPKLVLCKNAKLTVNGSLILNCKMLEIYGSTDSLSRSESGVLSINSTGTAIKSTYQDEATSGTTVYCFGGKLTAQSESGIFTEKITLRTTLNNENTSIMKCTIDGKIMPPAEWIGWSFKDLEGSSLTIEYCGHDDATYESVTESMHKKKCADCGFVGAAKACADDKFTVGYESDGADGHYKKCPCGNKYDWVGHSVDYVPTNDGKQHIYGCTVCDWKSDDGPEEHKKWDEYGACGDCKFQPILKGADGNLYDNLDEALENETELTLVSEATGEDYKGIVKQSLVFDTDKTITLNMGGCKLNSSSGPAIEVAGGELIVKGDAVIANIGVSSAVKVSGGTVTFSGDLTATGGESNSAAAPAIEVSGGTVTFEGNVTAKGGGAGVPSNRIDVQPAIYATGGELDFKGTSESQGKLDLNGGLTVTGSAVLKNKLTQGTFYLKSDKGNAVNGRQISVVDSDDSKGDVYKGVSDLLADGYAFVDKDDPNVFYCMNASYEYWTSNVAIESHTHTWGEKNGAYECSVCGKTCYHEGGYKTGACPTCGKPCPHEIADQSPVNHLYYCNDCGTQMFVQNTFGVRGETDYKYAFFTNLKDAVAAAGNGWTMTLLDDIVVARNVDIYDENDVARTITLNLNGKNITGGGLFWIGKLGRYPEPDIISATTLNIIGSGDIRVPLNIAKKATLNLESWTSGTISSVSVSRYDDAEGSLIVGENSANISSLSCSSGPASSIKNVELSGGTYGTISVTMNSDGSILFSDLLADGYAFQYTESGAEPGKFLDYALKAEYQNGGLKNIYNVRVVKCTTHVDENNDGKCDYCNTDVTTAQAKVVTEDGEIFYCDLTAAIAKANAAGGTITMQQDATGLTETLVIDNEKNFDITLDLNGCTISGSETNVLSVGSTVTICDGANNDAGGKIINTSVSGYAVNVGMSDYYSSPKLTIKGGTFGKSDGDSWALFVKETAASVTIEGGNFETQASFQSFRTVKISGGSFAYIYNNTGAIRSLLMDGYIYEGKNADSFKQYASNVTVVPCPHESGVNTVNNECTACGLTMTLKKEVTVGETTTTTYGTDLYTVLTEAENGAVVTLLGDIQASENAKDLTLGNNITINLNGKKLDYGDTISINATLSIIGSGDVKCSLINSYGTLDLSGWTGGTIGYVKLEDEARSFISGAGSIGTLMIHTPSSTSVRLKSGTYGEIKVGSTTVIKNLLADGYAFKCADGLYHRSVDELTTQDFLDNVTVVACPHNNITVDKTGGTCDICGLSNIVATVGDKAYTTTDTLQKAVEDWRANGGTLTLYADYYNTGFTSFTTSKPLELNLNGFPFNKDTKMTLGGAYLTVWDSREKTSTQGAIGPITADSGSLTLNNGGYLCGLTVPDDSTAAIRLLSGKVHALNCPYPVYKLMNNGYALMNGNLTVDPTSILNDPKSTQTYTVKDSQNQMISKGDKGSVAYSEKNIPLGLTLTTADSNVKYMQFEWYVVLENGTVQRIARSGDVPPNGGVYTYTFNASDVNNEYVDWNGLTVGEYEVLCVVTGKADNKAYKWQTAYGAYELTVTPAGLSGAAITVSGGNAKDGKGNPRYVFQPEETTGGLVGISLAPTFTVTLGEKTLILDKDYEFVGGDKGTNAGDYKLTIQGKGNYEGIAAKVWTIYPYELGAVSQPQITKKYDGTSAADANVNGFDALKRYTVDSKNPKNPWFANDLLELNASDFEITNPYFDKPDAGDRTFTYTIELKTNNFVFADGTRKNTIPLSSTPSNPVYISEAAAPANVSAALTVTNDLKKTYTFDLPALPELTSPLEYGEIEYTVVDADIALGSYYTTGAKIENGKLVLPIKAVKTETAGSIGTVKVKVKANNYNAFYIEFTVNAANKLKPTGQPTLSASEITFGDTLSKITLSGALSYNGTTVPGTFSWLVPDYNPKEVGDCDAAWSFMPEDNETYAEVTGGVIITVKAKSIIGAKVTDIEFPVYNGSAQKPTVNTVMLGETRLGSSDYDVIVTEKTEAGTYKLAISGKGNYTDRIEWEWTLQQKVVTSLRVSDIPAVDYTGKAIEPTVAVYDNDNKLIPDTEYVLKFVDNINAGTATVEIRNKAGGNYKIGDKDDSVFIANFTISKAAQTFTAEDITATYGDVPVTIKINGETFGDVTYGFGTNSATDVVEIGEGGVLTVLNASETPDDTLIMVKAAGDDNHYDRTVYVKVTVKAKSLTFRVLDRSAYVGETAPDLSTPTLGVDFELEGLLGDDKIEAEQVLAYLYYYQTDKETERLDPDMTKPGSYKITRFSASLHNVRNYIIGDVVDGTLTIDYAPPETYSITVAESENGTVTASRRSATRGTTVTLTVTPDEGYALSSLTVTDAKGNAAQLTETDGAYSFKMPGSKVTVAAAFEKISTEPRFDDVTPDDWFFDDVEWAADEGLVSGVTDTTFDPNSGCTRAHIVTMLWRAAGCPVVNYLMPFTDVAEEVWYTEAIRWAASERIVLGTSETTFTPDRICTRAQVAAMLYRYAAWAEMDTTQGGMAIREFDDYADIPEYALEPMGWAVNTGILVGSDNRLTPNADCTRAQIAAILHRALGK